MFEQYQSLYVAINLCMPANSLINGLLYIVHVDMNLIISLLIVAFSIGTIFVKGGLTLSYFQTPGPGTYRVIEPYMYKDRSPLYSMTGRNMLPSDTTRKPGPGAHSPEKV